MANLYYLVSTTGRRAISVVTALAVLFPLPALGSSCGIGAGDCPHCTATLVSAEKPSTQPEACCRTSEGSNRSVHASHSNAATEHASDDCSCHILPIWPASQPAPQISRAVETFAAPTQGAIFAPRWPELGARLVDSWLGRVPSAIPHRILHCSWLI